MQRLARNGRESSEMKGQDPPIAGSWSWQKQMRWNGFLIIPLQNLQRAIRPISFLGRDPAFLSSQEPDRLRWAHEVSLLSTGPRGTLHPVRLAIKGIVSVIPVLGHILCVQGYCSHPRLMRGVSWSCLCVTVCSSARAAPRSRDGGGAPVPPPRWSRWPRFLPLKGLSFLMCHLKPIGFWEKKVIRMQLQKNIILQLILGNFFFFSLLFVCN